MAKYVPDVKTNRWVVIAPGRTSRPDDDSNVKLSVCVLCEGNEHMTPPEVYRIGAGEKDKPGWEVRVVPNKYPITDIHEVIIHSPDCNTDIENLTLSQVEKVLTAYHVRYLAHEPDGHVMIFCNHGLGSGASLYHPHSQLVVIPNQISLDTLMRESVENVVEDNMSFIAYCPDFSQWPFETWITPKDKGKNFGHATKEQIADLAGILKRSLQRIEYIYKNVTFFNFRRDVPFSYNYYIHHGSDWYLRIIPRFVSRAGFEMGTGLHVNIVDPTTAANELKEIVLP